MSKKSRILLSLILGLFCTFILCFNNSVDKNIFLSSNSFFIILFFLLFARLFFGMFKCKEVRIYLLSFIASMILASSTCIGSQFVNLNIVKFSDVNFYLNILAEALILESIFIAIFNNEDKIRSSLNLLSNNRFLSKISVKSEKKIFIILAVLFLICWIPAYLAVFPGNFTYDGPIQVDQFFKGHLNQHHPIVHTLILNGFIYLGKSVFHSYDAGLGMYCWFQAIIVAISFAYLCCFMIKNNVPQIIVIFSVLFLAFNPIIQLFVFITTKDVIFASLMLIFIILTIKVIQNPEVFYNSKSHIIRYILVLIGMCLMRKQGIYVFLVVAPMLIFIMRKYWLKTLIISIIPVVFVFSFFGPICSLMHIIPDSPVEVLSVPLQQMARVMHDNPDSLSTSEKKEVYRFIPKDTISLYIPEISDPIKDNSNVKKIKEDKVDFLKTWYKVGKKNKNLYIQSFLYVAQGYFYPSIDSANPWSKIMKPYTSCSVTIASRPKLLGYNKYLYKAGTEFFKDIPILSSLVCSALPFWIMMIVTTILIKKRNYRMLVPMAFIFIFWLSLLLGPVYCIRYIYPLLICVPLIVAMPYCKKIQKS